MLTPHRVAGFVNARSWLKDVREHADPHLTCILVGNKVDLCSDSDDGPDDADTAEGASTRPKRKKREVPTEEAEIWALEEGLLFVEASAKSGVNVEAAFERATRDILDKVRRGVFDEDRVSASARAMNLRADEVLLASQSPGVKLSQPRNDSLTLEPASKTSGCC